MSTKLFDQLRENVEQAIAFERGDKSKARVTKRQKAKIAGVEDFTSNKIKKLRLKIGLTQEEFGYMLGVKKVTVTKWESGENHPQESTLRLLKILTIKPEVFIESGILLSNGAY